MALISLRQMLDHAAEHGYGVPAFNVETREAGEEDGVGAAGKLSADMLLTDPVQARDFNIDTDIRLAMTGAMRKALIAARNAARGICKARFEAFGCAGQASRIKPVALEQMMRRYARSGSCPARLPGFFTRRAIRVSPDEKAQASPAGRRRS